MARAQARLSGQAQAWTVGLPAAAQQYATAGVLPAPPQQTACNLARLKGSLAMEDTSIPSSVPRHIATNDLGSSALLQLRQTDFDARERVERLDRPLGIHVRCPQVSSGKPG